MSFALVAAAAFAAELQVSFADSSWTGKKIPTGQHCMKFGGNMDPENWTVLSEIFLGFQAAKSRSWSKYTASGVRRSSAL